MTVQQSPQHSARDMIYTLQSSESQLRCMAVRLWEGRTEGNPREVFQELLGDIMRSALGYGEMASVKYAGDAIRWRMEHG